MHLGVSRFINCVLQLYDPSIFDSCVQRLGECGDGLEDEVEDKQIGLDTAAAKRAQAKLAALRERHGGDAGTMQLMETVVGLSCLVPNIL